MADQQPAPTSSFKLSDAVAVFSQQTAAMNQLWAFYTATVLGSLAFGFTRTLSPATTVVFLIAYWAFAFGELMLMQQTLAIIHAVLGDLRACLDGGLGAEDGARAFEASLRVIAGEGRGTNPFWISAAVQVMGNVAVTVLLMARALGA